MEVLGEDVTSAAAINGWEGEAGKGRFFGVRYAGRTGDERMVKLRGLARQ